MQIAKRAEGWILDDMKPSVWVPTVALAIDANTATLRAQLAAAVEALKAIKRDQEVIGMNPGGVTYRIADAALFALARMDAKAEQ